MARKYHTVKLSEESIGLITWALLMRECHYSPSPFTGKWDKEQKKEYLSYKRLRLRLERIES